MAVRNAAAALDAAGLTSRPCNGLFQVQVYNSQTGQRDDDRHPRRSERPRRRHDAATISPRSSTPSTGIGATITADGELQITSDSAQTTFAFADDTSGVLAALGLNTFFYRHTLARHRRQPDPQSRSRQSSRFPAAASARTQHNGELLANLLTTPLASARRPVAGHTVRPADQRRGPRLAIGQRRRRRLPSFSASARSAAPGDQRRQHRRRSRPHDRVSAGLSSLRQGHRHRQRNARRPSSISRPSAYQRRRHMSGFYPVPSTRSTHLLAQTRLIQQLNVDQLDLLQLQTAISTGRRISRPGEDPSAAQRGQTLQRLLELKAQAQTNAQTAQSYLDATDTALVERCNAADRRCRGLLWQPRTTRRPKPSAAGRRRAGRTRPSSSL